MEYISVRTKIQIHFQSHTQKAEGGFGIVLHSSVLFFSPIVPSIVVCTAQHFKPLLNWAS